MSLLFLHKYQPKYFEEFETNGELFEVIQNLMVSDTLNIMLIGNMGCGKTTIINAIIREYYGKDALPSEYIDNILIINNLKDQGINYYRNEVKTFCQTSSSIKTKKKLVVLDDVDFINEQSQQVFRNYIDKYSKNVNFISTCSNKQKVIESIQSRLLILRVKNLEMENIKNIMNRIITKETIHIDEDAKDFIINVSTNNVKTVINYMEKIKLICKDIDIKVAMNICTNISYIHLEEFTGYIKKKDYIRSIKLLYNLYDKGYSVMDILDNYFLFVKSTSALNEDEKYSIIPIICKYITIFHNIHEDEIELALFINNMIQLF
jgi:DNA polymerase III delta prime subunit